MAHISIHTPAQTPFGASIALTFHAVVQSVIRYREYRRTRSALLRLNNHQLNDLGLSRSSITSVSFETAYGPLK